MDALAILQRFESGELIVQLADALNGIAEEVVETGNAGKVTLTLTIESVGKGGPEVVVKPSIQRTTPKREGRGTIFFAVEGGLHREDPRQTRLEFRTVDKATGEILDVPSERVERIVE